jgi:transmembrane sensor
VENNSEYIDDLIVKALSGEASADELVTIAQWRKLSTENENIYLEFEKLLHVGDFLRNKITVDTDAAWIKLKSEILSKKEPAKIISLPIKNKPFLSFRIAASIAIVFGLGLLTLFLSDPADQKLVEIISKDSVQKTELPDGSYFTLNKNSSLTYSSRQFKNKRVVKLKGEAFFNVKHDDANPFVVEAGDLKIEDIGTSFNVKAKSNSPFIIISVVSGEVKLTGGDDQLMHLRAGEEASYNIKTKMLGKNESIKENIAAYADKIFVFENADLKTVISVLNDVYDVKLSVENANLNTCRITVTFDNENINDIVAIIAETLGLKFLTINNQIIFQGDACK